MRVSLSAIALYTVCASAGVLPAAAKAEARQDNAALWYFITDAAPNGIGGFLNDNYYVFGPANTVPGAPAFAARCNTIIGCTNTVPGSDIHVSGTPAISPPLTVTQTFTVDGKNTTVTGVAAGWDVNSATAFTVQVS
ncbi:hypothetical protein F5Y03DRAFT_397015 [Xylaria venustula]|nr:hypothetical protein F5Y03DRAFT_397015 [Xylaria venustula]